MNDTTPTDDLGLLEPESQSVHQKDAIQELLVCLILIVTIIITVGVSNWKLRKYFPPSAAAMVFGAVLGGIIELGHLFNVQYEFTFSPEGFYFFLLPPIIFEAGYNMNHKDFFLNMGGILLYAILGTVFSALSFGFFLFLFSSQNLLYSIEGNNAIEALLFGSLISSIDPVATLSIMGSPGVNTHPTVYSLVFGESVLNDAVAITLFRTFDSYADEPTIGVKQVLQMLGEFALVSTVSFIIGVSRVPYLKQHPYLEVSLTVLFAYVSYLVSELASMSGVMSLFLAAVIMKHYNWYSLSQDAQNATHHLFKTLGFMAETFVFVYLGMNVVGFYSFELAWDPLLLLIGLVACFVSRFCNIFPLSAIANIKRKHKITFKMQIMMWFAGLRGAVSYALALNVRTSHRSQIITTTLFLIFFTTLVLGSLTSPLLKFLGLQNVEEDQDYILMENMEKEEGKQEVASTKTDIPIRHYSWAHRKWKTLDEKVMKPWFGGKAREPVEDIPPSDVVEDIPPSDVVEDIPPSEVVELST